MSVARAVRRARLSPLALLISWLLAAGGATAAKASTEPWIAAEPTAGLPTPSAALVLSGQEGGDLELSVGVFPVAAPRGRRLSLVLDLPTLRLAAAADAPSEQRTDVYVYAVDGDGGVAGFLSQAFPAHSVDRQAAGRPVKFLAGLELEPGDYSLRVLVRHRGSGRFGLRALALTLDREGPSGSTTIAVEPTERWSVVAAPGAGAEPPLPASVWSLDGEPVVPSASSAPAADPPYAWVELTSDLEGPSLRRTEPPAREQRAEPPAPSSPLGRRVWSGYSRREARYMNALALLAAEGPAAAESAIVATEEEVLAASPAQQKRFERARRRIGLSLAKADSSSLAPLIVLYEHLYRRHHREKRYQLATHSRQMVISLSRIYAEQNDSAEARRLVADALVSVAGYLVEVGSVLEGRAAFARALDYEKDDLRALAGLATIAETYGDYEAACDTLRRLIELQPDAYEARLRLAVNLHRRGKSEEAAALLEALLPAPAPAWVRALAHQELARLLAEEREAEATALLERGIDALPRHADQLRILLASLLDRRGDFAEARAVLASFHDLEGDDTPSARLRYSYTEWALRVAEEARQALAERALGRLPALARAIDRIDREPEVSSR